MSVEKIKSDLYINNKGTAKNEVLNLISSQLLFFFLFLEFSDNERWWRWQWERITIDGKNALGSKLPKKAGNVNKISSEAVAKSQKTVIIKSEDVGNLEQAKKRDHKIFITDTAIEKGEFG